MCYVLHMTVKRTAHAVYDTKYHLVWAAPEVSEVDTSWGHLGACEEYM